MDCSGTAWTEVMGVWCC